MSRKPPHPMTRLLIAIFKDMRIVPFVFLIMVFAVPLFGQNERSLPQKEFGINTGLDSEEIADAASDLGARWVRITFVWSLIEPEKGVFDWSNSDLQVERATQRGLKVCAILYGSPKWANGGHHENAPPRDADAWSEFVTVVVTHYKNIAPIPAYTIWNEPNIPGFWDGNAHDFIAKILIPGAQAVKRADPNALVVAPEFSHHWMSEREWALGDLIRSAGDQIDIVGVHYYPDAPVTLDQYLDRWINPARMGKPVWVTEIGEVGCTKKKHSLEKQTQAYTNLLRIISERSDWVTNVFPYRLWDPRDQCNKGGNGFGLTFGTPISERPAFQIYQEFIKTGGTSQH